MGWGAKGDPLRHRWQPNWGHFASGVRLCARFLLEKPVLRRSVCMYVCRQREGERVGRGVGGVGWGLSETTAFKNPYRLCLVSSGKPRFYCTCHAHLLVDFLNSLIWSYLNSRLNSHWLFRGGGLALLPTTQRCWDIRGEGQGNFNHHLSLPDSGWLRLLVEIWRGRTFSKEPLCGAPSPCRAKSNLDSPLPESVWIGLVV